MFGDAGRLRRDDRRRARVRPAGDRRRGTQPHLERAPPGSRRRWPHRPARPSGSATSSATAGARTAPSRRTTGSRSSAATPGPGCPDGQWYLHIFDPEQPDLNWELPEVRAEFEDDPAVLARPWRRRLPGRRRARQGQGAPACPTSASAARPAATSGRAGCWTGASCRTSTRTACTRSTARGGRSWTATRAAGWPSPRRGRPRPERLARYVGPDELHQVFNFDFLRRDLDRRLVPQGHRHRAGRGDAGRRADHVGAVQPRQAAARHPVRRRRRSACAGPAPPPC